MENVELYIVVNQSWNEAFSDLSGVVKNEMVSGDPRILEVFWPGAHRAAAIPEKILFPNRQANASACCDVDQGSRWEI